MTDAQLIATLASLLREAHEQTPIQFRGTAWWQMTELALAEAARRGGDATPPLEGSGTPETPHGPSEAVQRRREDAMRRMETPTGFQPPPRQAP